MFELICFVAALFIVVMAIVGWVNAHTWKSRHYEVLDECQFLDLQNTQLRQQLYAAPEEFKLPVAIVKPACAPVQHCSTAPAPASDGLVESPAIPAATDNAMIGGLVGGNILGGLLGEMLHDDRESAAEEAGRPAAADEAHDYEPAARSSSSSSSSWDDLSRLLDTSDSYSDSSSSHDSSSSCDSGSDSGFSSSDW